METKNRSGTAEPFGRKRDGQIDHEKEAKLFESSRAPELSGVDRWISRMYRNDRLTIDTFGIRACKKSCVDWHVLIGYARELLFSVHRYTGLGSNIKNRPDSMIEHREKRVREKEREGGRDRERVCV